MNQTIAPVKKRIYRWMEKFPVPRLKVFHQLLVIIIVMMVFFIIQGVISIYINDTMQRASLNIARISSDRFNNIIIVKTYIELIEKEYIKSLAGRGQVKYLINEGEVPGLPRIRGEMVPAVAALRNVAPEESGHILAHIRHIEKLIQLPLSEENLAILKKDLNSININIDAAANRSINTSFNAITESSNFSSTSKIVTIMISVIAIALLSAIYIFMLSRTITEPIKKLTAYAMEIAKGNFNTGKLDIHSSDDLNILAFAFNKMAASIQNMITEITEKSNLERKLHEEELKNVKISDQLNEARFLALQSQINPHFLFNTLNAIMRKSMFEKAKETTHLIQSLSNIFRYNLESHTKEVLLAEELSIVKEYVYIQQARFGERIGFNIVYRHDIGAVQIPRFIIQPLVENAVIHGLEPKEDGGSVRIKVYKKQNSIVVKIIDNGVGIPKNQIEAILSGADELYAKGHTTGIGINNVRDRMILYFKNPSCFDIRSKENFGTVISLRLTKALEGADHV